MAGVNTFDVEIFLLELQNAPFLYNKGDYRFKDTKMKENRWNIVAERCHLKSGEEAKKKWKNLLDTYRREKKMTTEKNRSGAGLTDLYHSKWKWYKSIEELMNAHIAEFSQTTSNLEELEQPHSIPNDIYTERNLEYENEPQILHTYPSSSSVSTPPSSSSDQRKKKRKQRNDDDDVRKLIDLTKEAVELESKDEWHFYCMSLAEQFRKLPPERQAELRFCIEEKIYKFNTQ